MSSKFGIGLVLEDKIVMLCYVMLCYVMFVTLCYVTLCHVMLCYVMLCYDGDRVTAGEQVKGALLRIYLAVCLSITRLNKGLGSLIICSSHK
jgi:hypothetical protein